MSTDKVKYMIDKNIPILWYKKNHSSEIDEDTDFALCLICKKLIHNSNSPKQNIRAFLLYHTYCRDFWNDDIKKIFDDSKTIYKIERITSLLKASNSDSEW